MKLTPRQYVRLAWGVLPAVVFLRFLVILRRVYFGHSPPDLLASDELISTAVGLLMLFLGVASFVPLIPMRSKKSILLYMPILLLLLYGLYELAMPVRMNIRVDLLVMYPAFTAVVIATVIRWALIIRHGPVEGNLSILAIVSAISGAIGLILVGIASILAVVSALPVVLDRRSPKLSEERKAFATAGLLTGCWGVIMFFADPLIDPVARYILQ